MWYWGQLTIRSYTQQTERHQKKRGSIREKMSIMTCRRKAGRGKRKQQKQQNYLVPRCCQIQGHEPRNRHLCLSECVLNGFLSILCLCIYTFDHSCLSNITVHFLPLIVGLFKIQWAAYFIFQNRKLCCLLKFVLVKFKKCIVHRE